MAGAGQTFTDVSNWVPGYLDLNSGGCFAGCGVSFYDFNKDGLDDLTFAGYNSDIRLFENIGNSFEELPSIANSEEAKQILWADIDNDGDADLFVSKYQAQCRLYENQNGVLVDITDASGLPITSDQENYGASFADYDRDGFLDLYIANYNSVTDPEAWTNVLLRNNGNLTFTDVTSEAGVGNGVQLSLGGVWLDYNRDLWPDLFVFNDKTIYANAMYLNNGDGTFSDVSAISGTDHMINAMSGTMGDYNNDGWLDIYVTNGPIVGNLLLRNNNGFNFTDFAPILEVQVFDMCWGAQWIDVDNNMWQDLYVAVRDWDAAPTPNHFYLNNSGSFEEDDQGLVFPGDDKIGWSNTVGDLDNDGWQDLVQYSDSASTLGLWKNTGGSNHYLKFDVVGTVSNRDAVGTWLEIHAGGITQYRYTNCGEDYLGQDSQHEIVGLGNNLLVDSLTILWPSGIVDQYYNIQADQHLVFTEAETISLSLFVPSNGFFCEGDSIQVEIGTYEEYQWSTGSTNPVIYPSTSQSIWVEVVDEFGLTHTSDTLVVTSVPPPSYTVSVTDVSCAGLWDGSAMVLTGDPTDLVYWVGQAEGPLYEELEAWDYCFSVYDSESICVVTDCIVVSEPPPLSSEIIPTDVSCFGGNDGQVFVATFGGTGSTTIDWQGLESDSLSAGVYTVYGTDENDCELELSWTINEPDPIEIDMYVEVVDENYILNTTVWGGTPPYSFSWSDGSTEDHIDEPADGDYSVIVTDSLGCSVDSGVFTFTGVRESNQNFLIVHSQNNATLTVVNDYAGACEVNIWNIEGRLIESLVVTSNYQEISTSQYTPGIYMVRAETVEGMVKEARFVVR